MLELTHNFIILPALLIYIHEIYLVL